MGVLKEVDGGIIPGEKDAQQYSYGEVAIHGMCFGVGIEKIGYGRFRCNLIGNDAIGYGPKIGSELNGSEAKPGCFLPTVNCHGIFSFNWKQSY